MTKQPRKFYKKLLTIFLIISIIPSIFIGIFSSIMVEIIIQNRLISESNKTTENAISSIDLLVNQYVDALEIFSQDDLIYRLISTSKPNSSDIQQAYKKMYNTLSLLNSAGDMHIITDQYESYHSVHGTPDLYDLSKNRGWGNFRLADNSDSIIVYPTLYTNPKGTDMIASVMKALRKDGQTLGYIAIDIPMESLKDQIKGSNDLLPINFTLMTDNYYLLFNDIGLEEQTNFISWPGRPLTSEVGYHIEKQADNRILYTYYPSSDYKFILVGGLNIDLIMGNLSLVYYLLIATILVSIFICILVSVLVSRNIISPLQEIVQKMQFVESGDFNQQLQIKDNDEFGYLASQFNIMCIKIKELFKNDREKQELLRIAEMKNLQSQINPHFLYNTLDSIKWLAKINKEEEIYTVSKNLSILLKNSAHISKEFVTIKESLTTLESYIAIQKIRFSNKFKISIQVEEDIMEYRTPNLLLQPLVENAMIHGLEPKPGKGTLTIRGFREVDLITLQVQDDGIGMDELTCERLKSELSATTVGEHIGLWNVHQRIKLYYGDEYGLSIESQLNQGSTFTLTLPWILDERRNDEYDSVHHRRG